jgi:chemotaxis protein MotB
MAEKQPLIVIKKINIAAAGAHGGSWKVAFADFMTAMMAFFLVMWLLGQTDSVKQNVADYFSTPSIIEYNFSNYGVELTLEKLFLDLINEPLKVFEAFIKPIDSTPNIMAMGSKNIVLQHLANEIGESADKVDITKDEITFEIPAVELFKPGTALPSEKFVALMEKIKGITTGLEDSNIYIDSKLYYQSVRDRSATTAQRVAEQRLDLVSVKIEETLESQTAEVFGKAQILEYDKKSSDTELVDGKIIFKIRHKTEAETGRKPRPLEGSYGEKDGSMTVYDNFVKQLTDKPKAEKSKRR